MVMVKVSETINAQPERVFAFMSDFSKAPQYSNYWKSVKEMSREGNSTTYETVAEPEGRKMSSMTRITGFPSEKMEIETIGGDGKGTKLTFTFQRIQSGTQVTLEGDIVLPGFAKMFGGMAKGRIESGMREELGILKSAVEKA